MKNNLPMKKIIRMGSFMAGMSTALCVAGNSAGKVSEGAPCAVVQKSGHGTQIIPLQGKIQTKFQNDDPVSCGSMIVTHKESMWVRLSNRILIKIAPGSFFEVARSVKDPHRLYRGDLLMSIDGTGIAESITTPNGKLEFFGGTAWLQYSADKKQTTVASFARSSKLMNKFSEKAVQEVRVGELSRVRLQADRVMPSQPEVIHPSSVKEVVARFELPKEEENQMVASIEQVYEGRAKSFTAELENWQEVEVQPERSIASVPGGKSSIDEDEAEHTMELLKERLYGSASDLRKMDQEDGARKPASVSTKKLEDPLYDKKKQLNKIETKRLIDEVSEMQLKE